MTKSISPATCFMPGQQLDMLTLQKQEVVPSISGLLPHLPSYSSNSCSPISPFLLPNYQRTVMGVFMSSILWPVPELIENLAYQQVLRWISLIGPIPDSQECSIFSLSQGWGNYGPSDILVLPTPTISGHWPCWLGMMEVVSPTTYRWLQVPHTSPSHFWECTRQCWNEKSLPSTAIAKSCSPPNCCSRWPLYGQWHLMARLSMHGFTCLPCSGSQQDSKVLSKIFPKVRLDMFFKTQNIREHLASTEAYMHTSKEKEH